MSRWLDRISTVGLLLFAGATFLVVATLAAVHVDDRYGVGAASGVLDGLDGGSARRGLVCGDLLARFLRRDSGTCRCRSLELVGRMVGGEYLVSAKVLIYAVNVALYVLVISPRDDAGRLPIVALVIVATVLGGLCRVDDLPRYPVGLAGGALLQLLAVVVVAAASTPRRAVFAGILCALAVATKVSALWAPAAIAVWLVRRSTERLVEFAAALVVTTGLLFALFESLTHGRLLRQAREFTFAGSGHSSLAEGVHRFYQLALRNERSLPLFLAIAGVVLVVSLASRQVGPYELGLLFEIPIVIVVMRDFGTYENHLIDLEVLSGLVVAGLWSKPARAEWMRVRRVVVVVCLVAAALAADRYTLIPDARAAVAHELRGRPDPRYSTHPAPQLVRMGTCALFEDASIPILAGQRPVVLDAFITDRLQTEDPRALGLLQHRIETGAFKATALNFPLTNVGGSRHSTSEPRSQTRCGRTIGCQKHSATLVSTSTPHEDRCRPTARAASFRSVASARPTESAFQSDRKTRRRRRMPAPRRPRPTPGAHHWRGSARTWAGVRQGHLTCQGRGRRDVRQSSRSKRIPKSRARSRARL